MSDGAEKTKRPASQYYWGDWFRDLALQSCSQPARGLWHEMNCLMHQGEPYGHLTMPNGKPMGPAQLANLCKISPAQCAKLLEELDENGVSSKDPTTGAIYSRRMVRDEAVRNARAAGGKGGSEHGVKGAEHGAKGGRPVKDKGGSETPLTGPEKPPPSSSPSSSSSPSGSSEPEGSAGKPASAPPSGELPGIPPTPAAPVPSDTASDKAEIWRTGRKLLVEADVPKGQAGSFIGDLVGKYGQPIVLDAVRAAEKVTPADPREYLKATCQRMAGERSKQAGGTDWTGGAE